MLYAIAMGQINTCETVCLRYFSLCFQLFKFRPSVNLQIATFDEDFRNISKCFLKLIINSFCTKNLNEEPILF